MSKAILKALEKLSPADISHWTEDGAPALEIMQEITGNPKLTRDDIQKAAPEFNRAKAATKADPDENFDDFVEVLEDLEALAAEVEKASAELVKLDAESQGLIEKRRELVEFIDNSNVKLRPTSSSNHSADVQAYFASQDKAAEERAARNAKLAELGLASVASDLDKALSGRKRQSVLTPVAQA